MPQYQLLLNPIPFPFTLSSNPSGNADSIVSVPIGGFSAAEKDILLAQNPKPVLETDLSLKCIHFQMHKISLFWA